MSEEDVQRRVAGVAKEAIEGATRRRATAAHLPRPQVLLDDCGDEARLRAAEPQPAHRRRRLLRAQRHVPDETYAPRPVRRLRLRLADVVQEAGELQKRASRPSLDRFFAEMAARRRQPGELLPELAPESRFALSGRFALGEHEVERRDRLQQVIEDVPVVLFRLGNAATGGHFRQQAFQQAQAVEQPKGGRRAFRRQDAGQLVALPLRSDVVEAGGVAAHDRGRAIIDGETKLGAQAHAA